MTSTPKYLTVDAFVARLGEAEAADLAGRGLRGGRELDADRLAAALIHADGLIDGYVRSRYPRPFATVPGLLAGIAHDIARWRLRSLGGQQAAMTEVVAKQYEAAMALLRDIGAGKVALDGDADGTLPDPGTHAGRMSGEMPPGRTGAMLGGWR